jgi:2-hydroxy-3-keto-5-methylthiopentenyl-1-phosphate phosphatase
MQPAKKGRKRNTVGFKSERERLMYILSLITEDEETCLNNALNNIGMDETKKQTVLASAMYNESQVYNDPDRQSSPSSSGHILFSRK